MYIHIYKGRAQSEMSHRRFFHSSFELNNRCNFLSLSSTLLLSLNFKFFFIYSILEDLVPISQHIFFSTVFFKHRVF
jgi:hypothetical protein